MKLNIYSIISLIGIIIAFAAIVIAAFNTDFS